MVNNTDFQIINIEIGRHDPTSTASNPPFLWRPALIILPIKILVHDFDETLGWCG